MAVITISVLAVLFLAIPQPKVSGPMPQIAILYNGQKYAGHLEGYRWKGNVFPQLEGEEIPYYPIPTVNVTYGSSIQFVANNTSQQPSYTGVSIFDITNSTTAGRSVIDQLTLPNNTLKVGVDGPFKYFEPSRKYELMVGAVWVSADIFGRHEDGVSYMFLVNTI